MRRRGRGALALAVFLAACDPFISVCHVCLKADPALPVPAKDRALVLGGDPGHPLPASATDLYYQETCGIDCTKWFRFDAPAAEADAYVAALFGAQAAASSAAGDPSAGPSCGEQACPWWPARFPGGATRHTQEAVAPVNRSAVVARHGARATVWMIAAET